MFAEYVLYVNAGFAFLDNLSMKTETRWKTTLPSSRGLLPCELRCTTFLLLRTLGDKKEESFQFQFLKGCMKVKAFKRTKDRLTDDITLLSYEYPRTVTLRRPGEYD